MTKQSTRIDGDENLASCCWNWEKKNNSKGNQKEGEGAVPDSGTTVGDGSRHGRSKRSGPGRAPAGRRVRERRAGKRNLSRMDRGGGSRGDGRCDGFRECAGVRVRGLPWRELYTQKIFSFFFLTQIQGILDLSLSPLFLWPGRVVSPWLGCGLWSPVFWAPPHGDTCPSFCRKSHLQIVS